MERLTDEQWRLIQPLLPKQGRGRPRAGDRETIDAVLYVLRTGCRWEDLTDYSYHYTTAWRRLKRWGGAGCMEKDTRHFGGQRLLHRCGEGG